MRKRKEPELRKSELLDAAQKLFTEKGYAKTTVTDILDVHDLSKGVFYYYFKSKEEVMDAVVDRIVDAVVDNAQKVMARSDMTPPQKLSALLTGQNDRDREEMKKNIINLREQFHETGNAEFHQKSFVETVKRLSPVLAELFREAAGEKSFSADYLRGIAVFALAAGETVFDEGFFHLAAGERAPYAAAFVEMIEKTLGLERGYFGGVVEILSGSDNEILV